VHYFWLKNVIFEASILGYQKANAFGILSIFLNQKSLQYFPRKTRSNFARILRDFKDFTMVTGICALFSALKRHFLTKCLK
jgi:hypothetical protein